MDFWLGRRGIKVPKIGFGTWKMQGRVCEKAVLKALEVGYRHIDTAQIYGNEENVGEAIAQSKIPRKEIFLTTKVWKDYLDFKGLLVNVSHSLQKLQVSYIDLLLIHWPNPHFPLEKTLSAFQELLKNKHVRYVGVSNFPPKELRQAYKICPKIICNQVEYHPFIDQRTLLKNVKKQEMFLTAYSPLARGKILTHSTLKSIAKKYNKTVPQIALRWLLDQENVVAIPKAKNLRHIASNFKIFDFNLESQDKKRIDKLTQKNKRLVHPEWAPKSWG